MATLLVYAGTIGGQIVATSTAGASPSVSHYPASFSYAGQISSGNYYESFVSFSTSSLPDSITCNVSGTELSIAMHTAPETPGASNHLKVYHYAFADSITSADWRTPTQISALPFAFQETGNQWTGDTIRVTMEYGGTQANLDANVSRTGFTKFVFVGGPEIGESQSLFGMYVPDGTSTTTNFPALVVAYTVLPPEINETTITWSCPTEIAPHSAQFIGPNNTPATINVPVTDPNGGSVTVKAYTGPNRTGTLMASATGFAGTTITLTIPYTAVPDGTSLNPMYISADNGTATSIDANPLATWDFDRTNPTVNHIRTTDSVIADGEYTVLFTVVS